ncbi:MAG: two-component system, response regulator YesN [Clostridiales bacterium]|nr:two-component system, response regulator YesN [Clostridiales bacterium]
MHIIIADSESKTVQQIKRILLKHIKGVKLLIASPDTSSVIRMVNEVSPALVILEAGITERNGLDIAKYLSSSENNTKVILISYYNHYEYMREALRCGVHDYLVKPFTEGQLAETCLLAIERYKESTRFASECEEKENHVQEARRHVEYSLIYSALFNGEASEEIKNYKKMFSLGEQGYILNIEIDSFDSDSMVNIKKDDVKINSYLRKIISEHNNCIVGPRMLNRILVWIDVSEKGRKVPDSPMADIKLAAHIIIALKERFLINVSIGVGGETSIYNLHGSYEEAVRCLRYKGVHNVMRIRDVEHVEVSPIEYNELENRLLKSIKFGKTEIINLFVELLDQIRGLEENVYRNKLFEILVLVAHESRMAGQNSLDYIDFRQYFGERWDMPIEQLEIWGYQRFEYLINSVQSSRLKIRSDAVNSAIRYMEEHYMEEISLEEIARYIGISPQHFSKLFKEETGSNYIDWLTNLRLDIAKRLLSEGDISVKEVCYRVGYNDPNYFSRIFRKVVHVSPTVFAKGDASEKTRQSK